MRRDDADASAAGENANRHAEDDSDEDPDENPDASESSSSYPMDAKRLANDAVCGRRCKTRSCTPVASATRSIPAKSGCAHASVDS